MEPPNEKETLKANTASLLNRSVCQNRNDNSSRCAFCFYNTIWRRWSGCQCVGLLMSILNSIKKKAGGTARNEKDI